VFYRGYRDTYIFVILSLLATPLLAGPRAIPGENWVSATERLAARSQPADPQDAERIRIVLQLSEWESSVTRFGAAGGRLLPNAERSALFQRLYGLREISDPDVTRFVISGLGLLLSGYNRGEFGVPADVIQFLEEDIPTTDRFVEGLRPVLKRALDRIRFVPPVPRVRETPVGRDAIEFIRMLNAIPGDAAGAEEVYRDLEAIAGAGLPLAASNVRDRLTLESNLRRNFEVGNARRVKIAIDGAGLLLDENVMEGEKPPRPMIEALTSIVANGPPNGHQRVLEDLVRVRQQTDETVHALRRSYAALSASGLHQLADGEVLSAIGEQLATAEQGLSVLDGLFGQVPTIRESAITMIKNAAQNALRRMGAIKEPPARRNPPKPVEFNAEDFYLRFTSAEVAERLEAVALLKLILARTPARVEEDANVYPLIEEALVNAVNGDEITPSQTAQIQISLLEAFQRIPAHLGRNRVPAWLRNSGGLQLAIARLLLHENPQVREAATVVMRLPMTPAAEKPGVNHSGVEEFFVRTLTAGRVRDRILLMRGMFATFRESPSLHIPDWLSRSEAIQTAIAQNLFSSRDVAHQASRLLIYTPRSQVALGPAFIGAIMAAVRTPGAAAESYYTALYVLGKLPEIDDTIESEIVAQVADSKFPRFKRRLAAELLSGKGVHTLAHFKIVARLIPNCPDSALKFSLARTAFRSLEVASNGYSRGDGELSEILLALRNDLDVGDEARLALNELHGRSFTGRALSALEERVGTSEKRDPAQVLLEACRAKSRK